MRKSIMYVGMDQHKESIEIATADEGRDGEVRRYGCIDGELDSLDRVVRKLVATGKELRMVYEVVSGVMSTTLEPRAKQLRDVQKSGGNQPTNISLINRR